MPKIAPPLARQPAVRSDQTLLLPDTKCFAAQAQACYIIENTRFYISFNKLSQKLVIFSYFLLLLEQLHQQFVVSSPLRLVDLLHQQTAHLLLLETLLGVLYNV